MRVFDEHTRAEIKRKRLESLERDNWHDDKRGKGDDDDDDAYDPLLDASSGDGERLNDPPPTPAHPLTTPSPDASFYLTPPHP